MGAQVAEMFESVVIALFSVDSIWSVVLRGLIWLGVALVIIVSIDNPNPESSTKNLKSNLGFFLMFLIATGAMIGMLFTYVQG